MPRLSIVRFILLRAFYAILMGPISYERRRAVRMCAPKQVGPLRSLANSNVLLLETRAGLQSNQ
jgi:hypothetical protein